MAESVLLVAKRRTENGTQAANRLRRKGQLPGVLYGHKEETVPVALNRDAVRLALRQNARLVELDTEGKKETALICDLQFDHLGKELLHIDFRRVSRDERIVVPVRLDVRGIAPGVAAGGVLDQPIHSFQVECLAIAVPQSIRINIGEMQIGSIIHVKDVVLPEGCKVIGDPEAIVIHVKAPQTDAEAVPGAPVAETAEPEVIGRKAAADEAEEEK